MSDQAGLINGKRSANREQQTLPGGLRTPAEKDVLFSRIRWLLLLYQERHRKGAVGVVGCWGRPSCEQGYTVSC